jgi:hypothetical protein
LALADDFLEVVDALDLFPQVKVLLLEADLLLLGEHAIGHIHDHRAGVFLVLAAEFNQDAAGVGALANRREGILSALSVLGRSALSRADTGSATS